MTIRLRLFYLVGIVVLLLSIGPGCTNVAIENSGGHTTEQDQLIHLPDLNVRQFGPALLQGNDIDDPTTSLAGIEARLFSVNLRQMLADSGTWNKVYTIFETDRSNGFILEGQLTDSGPNELKIEIHFSNTACNVKFSRIYTSRLEEDPAMRFREISDLILLDITDLMSRISSDARVASCMELPSILSNNGRGASTTAEPFAEIISESIETFWDIYYEDLIDPFSGVGDSGGSDASSLLEQEQHINEAFLKGVAATAAAVLSRCTSQRWLFDTPLQTLLASKPFTRYSNFQPDNRRTELLHEARNLGLVVNEQPDNHSPRLSVGGQVYVLEGTLQAQNDAWRHMIVDMCGISPRSVPDT